MSPPYSFEHKLHFNYCIKNLSESAVSGRNGLCAVRRILIRVRGKKEGVRGTVPPRGKTATGAVWTGSRIQHQFPECPEGPQVSCTSHITVGRLRSLELPGPLDQRGHAGSGDILWSDDHNSGEFPVPVEIASQRYINNHTPFVLRGVHEMKHPLAVSVSQSYMLCKPFGP